MAGEIKPLRDYSRSPIDRTHLSWSAEKFPPGNRAYTTISTGLPLPLCNRTVPIVLQSERTTTGISPQKIKALKLVVGARRVFKVLLHIKNGISGEPSMKFRRP